ncbi:MAG: cell surface protein SprA, partial [Bacteroidales bacterium]|nr:cell surface protein SprA [Bacteroidales bacterium]
MKNKLFLNYLSPLVFLLLFRTSFFDIPQEPDIPIEVDDYSKIDYELSLLDTPENKMRSPIPKEDNNPLKNTPTSPFSLRDPANKTQHVVYDPKTNTYSFQNKIGDLNDGPSSNLSLKEYLDYDIQKSLRGYWRERAGATRENESSGIIPQLRVPSEIFENIFGSNLIDIRPSGSIEVIFKVIHTRTQNENVSVKNRNQTQFDFDANIQLNLKAKIGDKIAYDLNYNTMANFEFENKFKLRYEGKEDEIIKVLEFGNVTMPLSSSLIQGSQTLFGGKAQLQFGKLMLTTVVSRQDGDKKTITVSGGAELNEYEFRADEYEEDRHFFLAQYFYDNYNEALSTLPLINSKINITRIEVWRTNIGSAITENRNIIALADLGEPNPHHRNVRPRTVSFRNYPNVNANDLLQGIDYNQLRDINTAFNYLKMYRGGMTSGIDFEKVESARLLNSNEYTFNSKLGFISLNSRLNTDQVLAVAFQYTVLGDTTVYQVGQFSNEVETPNCIMVKLLKSTSVNTQIPLWKLMMKNVYSLNTYQLSAEKFRLNILYRGEEGGIPMGYFSEVKEEYQGIALIRLLGADRLNLQLAAIPDGVFDYVDNAATDGGTVQSNTGRVYLPLVEPFGKDLRQALASDPTAANMYAFDSLYAMPKVMAQQYPDRNKFYLEGSFKSALGSVISLGMGNLAEGSVKVAAGGIQLTENVDYTVDYNMGSLRITNESYLQSGTPLTISLESQNLFGQKKTMFGLNAEYTFSKDLLVGATILNLRERTPDGRAKVNFGDEPINNTIWGMNLSYQKSSRLITKILNYLPFYSSTTDSRIQFNGEFAHFIPGHSRLIGRGKRGELYIDDFEAAITTYDLRLMSMWHLASTPQNQTQRGMFPEAAPNTGLEYGFNRAKLAWYNIDPIFHNDAYSNSYFGGSITKDHRSDMYARKIKIVEVFPNRPVLVNNGEDPYLVVLDLAYYPNERGPYNYDALGVNGISAGLDSDGTLKSPQSRWAGIMRKLDNADFENTNVEYVQFWMLDPFLDNANHTGGDFYINLGDISEDILRDGRKSFEHGLSSDGSDDGADYTIWGRVPINQSIVMAFDSELKSRRYIDVGLDGLYDSLERAHFAAYLNTLQGILNQDAYLKIYEDPSADNYHYFRGSDYNTDGLNIMERYKMFNNPDGNSPTLDDRPDDAKRENYLTQATSMPDMEDINSDNTMQEDERYYQYKMELKPGKMNIGENYITDIQEGTVKLDNGNVANVKWYQFKVPVKSPNEVIGAISGFSSIRFMRMYVKGFSEAVVLRFAELSLVRGNWRRYTGDLREPGDYVPGTGGDETSFNVSTLNLEENSQRFPIPYVMPKEVEREESYVQQSVRELNEQSLTMRVINLFDGDAKAVYKNTNFDFRRFGSMKLYVHAEKAFEYDDMRKGDMVFFVRLGSDFTENYYEYEMAIDFTNWGETSAERIWEESNYIDIKLQDLVNLKQERNIANRNGGSYSLADVYAMVNVDGKKMSVVGSPNLGDIKIIMMGVRNPRKKGITDNDDMLPKSAEIWVNEMRLGDFEEKGGWAALGNVKIDLADLGDIALSASVSTAGFGVLESSTYDRQQETLTTLDFSTNIQMGKMLPSKWAINLPVHYDFSRNVASPEYNPLNPDVKLREDLKTYNSKAERDSIKRQSLDVVQRQNFNIVNARKDKGANSSGKNHIWDIENFDFSYAYTEEKSYNIDYEFENMYTHTGGFGYTFSTQPKKIQPFGKIEQMKKQKWLQLFYDFNFFLYPRDLSFRTNLYRMFSESKLRNKSKGLIITEPMYVKAYEWSRDYVLAWDLSQSLKFDYRASANAYIMEPPGKIDTKEKKAVIRQSFSEFGKMNSFNQDFNASYQIPINKIPVFSFITSSVRYGATYSWMASAEAIAFLGNSIENSNTKQFNVSANFVTLYNKSKYLRKVNQGTFGSSLKDKPILKKKETAQPDLSKLNLTREQQDSVKRAEKEKEDLRKNVGKEVLDNFIRLLMMIKNVSFDYKEGNGTAMTGYMLEPDILGLNLKNNGSPGFLFVFGVQDEDLRYIASQNGWLTGSDLLNTPYLQRYNTQIQMRATIEPIKDLKIDLTANRTYSYVDQSYYIPDSNGIYRDYSQQRTGNFSITTICTPTLFIKSEKETYMNQTFENFKEYRVEIANRLAENRANQQSSYSRGTGDFPDGYGHLDQEVLLYAFWAAYSGKSTSSIAINSPLLKIPLPNWRISYNGITKIPGVNKVFQSITLQHAYSCMYQIGGFATNMTYNPEYGDLQVVRDALNNFIPYIEVGQIAITEAMNPLIGVDMTLKNSLQFRAEWRKSRTVTLSLANFQVTEVANNELIFGAGYRFQDLKITFNFAGVRRQTEGGLTLRADFSIRDNKTVLRKIEEDVNLASAGQKTLSIAVNGEYQVTKNIFFKLFYDHTLNTPALA